MASKHDLLPNNFKFNFESKFVGIPFCILALLTYITVLFTHTTCTYQYKLERPTELIQHADPVLLSLHISYAELQNVSSLAHSLFDDSNNQQPLRDCIVLLQFATIQLNQSINKLLTVGQGDHEVFVGPDILAVTLLIKASLASQEKCLDGLEKMQSTVLNDLRLRVQRSEQCTSNSSAIVAELYPLNFRAFRRRTCLFKYICVQLSGRSITE